VQPSPSIHARLQITGNIEPELARHLGWELDMPFEEHISLLLGIRHTSAEYEDGLLTWDHALPKEDHWELPETVEKLVNLFVAKRVRKVAAEYGLYVEVAVSCYVTDSHPSMNFSPELLSKIAALGAHLDLDLYRTAGAENNRDIL